MIKKVAVAMMVAALACGTGLAGGFGVMIEQSGESTTSLSSDSTYSEFAPKLTVKASPAFGITWATNQGGDRGKFNYQGAFYYRSLKASDDYPPNRNLSDYSGYGFGLKTSLLFRVAGGSVVSFQIGPSIGLSLGVLDRTVHIYDPYSETVSRETQDLAIVTIAIGPEFALNFRAADKVTLGLVAGYAYGVTGAAFSKQAVGSTWDSTEFKDVGGAGSAGRFYFGAHALFGGGRRGQK